MKIEGIDVVGDLHGQFPALLGMLDRLGYSRSAGRWRHHAGRKLAFVGDYIDRGERSDRVVEVVRELEADRMAIALAGNHDTNAIAYCMRRSTGAFDPEGAWRDWNAAPSVDDTDWMRPHDGKNRAQHLNTLKAFESASDYGAMVRHLRACPLWLDLPGLRVVHAAWIEDSMRLLDDRAVERGIGSPGIRASSIDEAMEIQASRTPPDDEFWRELLDIGAGVRAHELPADHSPAIALERILKGVELALPNGSFFVDGDGHERREIRVRWFDAAEGRPYGAHALMKPGEIMRLGRDLSQHLIERPRDPQAARELARRIPFDASDAYPADAPPVLFGHYALFDADDAVECGVLRENVGCVDHGIAYPARAGARLTAYRWCGEQRLLSDRFVSVSP